MIRPLALLLALVPPALAATVVVQREGVAVANAEVCRFAAGDRENPFKRWLGVGDVVCTTGVDVARPKGLWNVFARTTDGVSATVLVDGDERVTLSLQKAAAVKAQLPEKQRGVIYVPRRATAIPVEPRTVVPADEELWLIVLDKSTPTALFTIPPLAAGSERSVDGRSEGAWAVLGWLEVPEEDRKAVANATGILSPGIRAIAGAAAREADALPPLPLLHGAFVRVREVPEGSATLRVEGRGWLREQQAVKVMPGLTVVAQPLRIRAAGTLTVHWSSSDDLVALNRSLSECDAAEHDPQVVIAVSACHGDACAPFREEKFEPALRYGIVTLDDIPPGTYRAELRFGKLPPAGSEGTALPMQSRDMWISASYLEVDGSITHGGEPLREKVKIEFPSGDGFAPAETDEYHAVIRGALRPDSQIKVAACDGDPKATVLTDEPLRPKSRFDIDVPANELVIRVTDTFTREALNGAAVKYEVMSLRGAAVVLQGTTIAGTEGSVSMKAVPAREIRLVVSHPGYQKQTVPLFTMPKRDTKTIDIQLVPLRGNQGRITSDHPFDSGVVVWFSERGRETERADLAPDGTFVYSNWHTPDETMTVVSLSHPLWVLRSPAIDRREAIALQFPKAPLRTFSVAVSRDSWPIAVAIGGVRIPPPVLAMHQTLRRDAVLARAGKPMQIRDLLATGPIDVFLDTLTERLAPDQTQVTFTIP